MSRTFSDAVRRRRRLNGSPLRAPVAAGAVVAALSVLAAACGGGPHAPTATPSLASTPMPSPSPHAAPSITLPAASATAPLASAATSTPAEDVPSADAATATAGPASGDTGVPTPEVIETIVPGTPDPIPSTQPPIPPTPVPVVTLPPAPPGSYTMAQAQALLSAATITAADLAGAWSTTSDATLDNAAAAAGDAALAASFTRCGRLLGRVIEDRPADLIGSFLAFKAVSVLAQLTAYATAAGAADCTAELRQRYLQPGELASALGVFNDPSAVILSVVDFPTIGDESFAVTLTGRVKAGIYDVNVKVLIVLFRTGNLRGALGVTRAAVAPGDGADELTPPLNLFLRRIAAHR